MTPAPQPVPESHAMPPANDPRERLTALEINMKYLTNEMAETKDAIKELTEALHQMRGGTRLFMLCLAVAATLCTTVWTVGTWVYDHLGR